MLMKNINLLYPLRSEAREEMAEMYDCLYQLGQLQLYGAVSTVDTDITNSDKAANVVVASKKTRFKKKIKKLPAVGGYTVPPKLLEEILNMPMSAITPQSTNTIILVQACGAFLLLECIVSFTTGIPLFVLVLAAIAFTLVDRMLINGTIIHTLLCKIIIRVMQPLAAKHEAGHFLMAYLFGCPVEGFVSSGRAAQQDRRFNGRVATAGISWFDPILARQFNIFHPRVTRSSIDRFSIVVMAGIAAEANEFNRVRGGNSDIMQLARMLPQLASGCLSTSENDSWNSETIKNQERWSVLQAVLILRHYKPCYDALVDTLERGGTLGECIYSIEKAGRDNNLHPLTNPVGYLVDDPSKNCIKWTTTIPTTSTIKK